MSIHILICSVTNIFPVFSYQSLQNIKIINIDSTGTIPKLIRNSYICLLPNSASALQIFFLIEAYLL